MIGCSPSVPSASIPDRSGAAPTLPRRQGERRRDRKGAWAVTRSPVLMTASSPAGHCLALTFSQEVSRNRAIPFAATDFVRAFPRAQTSLQQESIARAGEPHLRLDADLPCVPRHCLGPSQFGHCAEWVILLDMVAGFTLAAQFQPDAVDALDTHITATKPRRLLRWRRLRPRQRQQPRVCGLGRAQWQIERASKNQQRRLLRGRPNHWPISRR